MENEWIFSLIIPVWVGYVKSETQNVVIVSAVFPIYIEKIVTIDKPLIWIQTVIKRDLCWMY